jgi:phage N-6-adenine-methyltransferase
VTVNAERDADDRGTTPDLFLPLDRRFGGFTVDVAAASHNTKCARFYSVAVNGLAQPWAGERVWCNPPYSDIEPWVRKAWFEMSAGCELVVMLLPANRTEQGWWQDLVEPYRDRPGSLLRVEFLRGRHRFLAPGQRRIGPGERPPFGCVLLVWQHTAPAVQLQPSLLP